MSKIITKKLSEEIKNKIKKEIDKLECGITTKCLDNFKDNINIKYIECKGDILAFCIYSDIIKDRLLRDLEVSCYNYENEAYEYYEKFIQDMKEDTIYIHFLEAIKRGHGYGKELVDAIIKSGKEIILYSTADAEEFWEANDFENIFGYEYMYYTEEL